MRCAGSRYIAACPFGLVLGRREAEVRKTFFVLVCQPIAKMPPQVVLGADPMRRHRRRSRDGDKEAGIAAEIRAFSPRPRPGYPEAAFGPACAPRLSHLSGRRMSSRGPSSKRGAGEGVIL